MPRALSNRAARPSTTIFEKARRTVCYRLLALNHERYAEEVRQGLHDKGAKKVAKGKRGKTAAAGVEQGELFGES